MCLGILHSFFYKDKSIYTEVSQTSCKRNYAFVLHSFLHFIPITGRSLIECLNICKKVHRLLYFFPPPSLPFSVYMVGGIVAGSFILSYLLHSIPTGHNKNLPKLIWSSSSILTSPAVFSFFPCTLFKWPFPSSQTGNYEKDLNWFQQGTVESFGLYCQCKT